MVFVLKPHKECLSTEGFRMIPKLEELHEYTDRFINLLNKLNVKYKIIDILDINERVKIILDYFEHVCPDLVA